MVAPGDQHEVTIPHMVQGASCHRPTESLPPEHSTQPRSGRNFAVDTGMGAVGARPSLCTNYRETLKGREFAGKRKPVGTAAGRVRSLTRKNKTLRVEKPPETWNAYKGERELLARIFFSKKCSSLKKTFHRQHQYFRHHMVLQRWEQDSDTQETLGTPLGVGRPGEHRPGATSLLPPRARGATGPGNGTGYSTWAVS